MAIGSLVDLQIRIAHGGIGALESGHPFDLALTKRVNAKSGPPGPLFAHSYRVGIAAVSALPVMVGQFPEHTAIEHHAQFMGGFVAIAGLGDVEPEVTVIV